MKILDRILVPIDFSASAESAARRAMVYAQAFDAQLVFLYVVSTAQMALTQPVDGRSRGLERMGQAQERLNRWVEALGFEAAQIDDGSVDCVVVEGDVIKQIVKHSSQVDLLVMRSEGRNELGDWLMGTRTERVLSQAHCELLVLRSEDRGD